MNIVEHVPLLYVGVSSGYMTGSSIAGFSDTTMSNILRNSQTDLQSGCIILTIPPAIEVAIPGCQLDYIWNELQSIIGRLTYEPNLETEIQVSDLDLGMEILKHSDYQFKTIKIRRSCSSRSSVIKG